MQSQPFFTDRTGVVLSLCPSAKTLAAEDYEHRVKEMER